MAANPPRPVFPLPRPAAASAGRPNQTDLLLCGHHYRVSRQALRKAGAFILGINGVPLGQDEQPQVTAGAPASSVSLT